MGLLDPPGIARQTFDTLADRAEAAQEAVFTRHYNGSISATTTQPISVFVAPWPCRLLVATITIPDSGGVIASNASNYWQFEGRRYRALIALPAPVDTANGFAAGNISLKNTTGHGIQPRFAYRLTQTELDAVNSVFAEGEMFGMVLTKAGTVVDLLNPVFQARVERI